MKHLTFSIEPVSPFRLDLTAWAIRRRPENIIDWWDGETYRRVLPISGRPALVSVVQSSRPSDRLDVTVSSDSIRRTTQSDVTMALERLLGVRIDLHAFYAFAQHDRKLQQLAQRFIGLKPPRFPTVFEALVNGIACQQLSLAVGYHPAGQTRGSLRPEFRGPSRPAAARFPPTGRPGEGDNSGAQATRFQHQQESSADRFVGGNQECHHRP